jgi:hypothetical protein
MLTIANALWAVFGLWPRLFGRWPQVGLFLFAVVTSVMALLVWKYASNQKAISRAKDRIKANFLGMALFMDSLSVLLASIAKTFGWIFVYLGRQLIPLAIMMIPILPLLAQVDHLYSFSPVVADPTGRDRAAVVQVVATVDPKINLTHTPAELTASGGVELLTKAVRMPYPQTPWSAWEEKPVLGWFARLERKFASEPAPEIHWQVRGVAPGRFALTVRVGDATATKEVLVATAKGKGRLRQIARKRHGGGLSDGLEYPGEPALTGPIKSIEIVYPRKKGWWHWAVIYFVETIVVAFALKGPMKVDF